MSIERIKQLCTRACGLLAIVFCLFSCSETDSTWNPYYNWEARNAEWFQQVADTARTAITKAKARYGDQWEDHCQWRMYKSLLRSAKVQGDLTDTICVRILAKGDGLVSPAFTDSVSINFRGWTMETEYETDDGKTQKSMAVFTQTYYGQYDPSTAAAQVMLVSGTVEGFSTALQYMKEGDDWMVYIPQKQGYADQTKGSIPAYSTLLYRLTLIKVHQK